MRYPNLAPRALLCALATLAFTMFHVHAGEEPSSLTPADARWKHRPIVIASTEFAVEKQLTEQLVALQAAGDALRERDIRVILLMIGEGGKLDRATIDGQPLSADAAAAWREKVNLGKTGFGIALIGKDGSRKMHSHVAVPAEKFTALIDTMPMRQEEAGR